jgi:hypothetical protein
MTQVVYTSSDTLAVAGISGLSGTIDVGTNHGSAIVEFTVPDGDLAGFFGADDGFIHITIDGPGGGVHVTNNHDFGLIVDIDSGNVTQDDGNWVTGTPGAIEAEPTVTLNYTSAPTFNPAWARGSNVLMGMN